MGRLARVGMESVFAGLASLSEVRSVVLTGSGSVFCAGADLVAGFPVRPTATTTCARHSAIGSTRDFWPCSICPNR